MAIHLAGTGVYDDSPLITVRGTYARCTLCRAPVMDPFPPGWTLTMSMIGEKTLLTPHQPNCQASHLYE
ncbi:MAG TPA: hypothetical protein VFR23_04205 [Jiangellaceae bacterium]|nr:hypothetical protein [Jiangellaceae bacterium]